MKRGIGLTGMLAAAWLTTTVAAVSAGEIKTRLSGYEETPLTINTTGSGTFKAKINHDETAIDYELTYQDLSSNATQAHIHFGRPAISGMIVLFLCTNLTPLPVGVPAPQACPNPPNPGTITGTLTAADVIARAVQGIDGGAAGFAEMLDAIRAGAAYVNVHTDTFGSGEIRGRLRGH
jgi:hypothetical protein